MEQTLKYAWGGAASILSLLAPTGTLIVCAVIFIGVDFVTGVMADRKRARLCRRPWAFRSDKAWDTVSKLGFVLAGIVLAHLIDCCVITFVRLNLANLFTGFVCGVEFWSYLENAAVISDHPVFRWLRKFMQNKMEDVLGAADDATQQNADSDQARMRLERESAPVYTDAARGAVRESAEAAKTVGNQWKTHRQDDMKNIKENEYRANKTK